MIPIASFIIATHNRGYCICTAIDSALDIFISCESAVEVVVVDDFSTDKTETIVSNKYKTELDAGVLKYIKLPANRGVSGARNVGVSAARGSWVVFLDSDDILINSSGPQIANELTRYADYPVIFFRCIDQEGKKVGTSFHEESQFLNLQEFLRYGSRGECLVAVNKFMMTQTPFAEELRGYEGLTIARILKKSGKSAILSSVIARKYIQTGDDRLSSRAGFARRVHLISRGHWLMAKEFAKFMPLRTTCSYIIKSLAYGIVYYKDMLIERVRR